MSRTLKARSWISGAACALSVLVSAQADSLADRYGRGITEADLQRHLGILAGDTFEGRETGKNGQWKAADYLRGQFEAMGADSLGPRSSAGDVEGFYQYFDLVESTLGGIRLMRGSDSLLFGQGLLYFSEALDSSMVVTELVNGSGLLDNVDGIVGKDVILDAGSWGAEVSLALFRERLTAARGSKPRTILVVMDDLGLFEGLVHSGEAQMRLAYEGIGTKKEMQAQVMLVKRDAWQRLVGAKTAKRIRRSKPGKAVKANLTVRVAPMEGHVRSANVLAFIEGSDLKEELVVLTAHYDHIGIRDGVVYNGADDDGTGTVALLEIAEAFAQARREGHGPRRSVLVMPVSGEEKGLLGSRYYSDHPAWPLERTIADLNIDMIGRRDSAHAEGGAYVYVIGSDRLSQDLHAANERANARVGLDLDYTFNAPDDPNRFYYRSDHYNFARKGIPSIFYFSGVHEDYHQPGDDVEKIRFDLLRARTLLVFYTAWDLANAQSRPRLDKERP